MRTKEIAGLISVDEDRGIVDKEKLVYLLPYLKGETSKMAQFRRRDIARLRMLGAAVGWMPGNRIAQMRHYHHVDGWFQSVGFEYLGN